MRRTIPDGPLCICLNRICSRCCCRWKHRGSRPSAEGRCRSGESSTVMGACHDPMAFTKSANPTVRRCLEQKAKSTRRVGWSGLQLEFTRMQRRRQLPEKCGSCPRSSSVSLHMLSPFDWIQSVAPSGSIWRGHGSITAVPEVYVRASMVEHGPPGGRDPERAGATISASVPDGSGYQGSAGSLRP